MPSVSFLSRAFGNKHNRAMTLLSEGRRSLPSESLVKFQKAKQLFDEVGDNLQSSIAEAEYLKALGKVTLSKDPKQALCYFEKSAELFSSAHEYDSVSGLQREINRLKLRFKKSGEMKDRLRTMLNSVDFKSILYDEATRICNALDIDSDTLNELLGQFESEGLVKWTGECYRIMTKEVQRIEVRHVSVDAIEALKCPVCGGKLSPEETKCEYCGVNVRIS